MDRRQPGRDELGDAIAALDAVRRAEARRGRALRAAWGVGSALLCVLLLDAIVGLGPAVRGIAGLALCVGILSAWRWVRAERSAAPRAMLRDARRLEVDHDLPHNPLVNGLWLGMFAEPRRDALAVALAQRTHARAAAVASRLDHAALIDRGVWRNERIYAALAATTWVLTLTAAPGVIAVGLTRLAMPWADVPPFAFSRVQLSAPPVIREGDDVPVIAGVTGDPVDGVTLVVRGPAGEGAPRHGRAMAREAGGAFVHTLRAVDRPLTVRAEAANGARSKWLRLAPTPRPPAERAAVEACAARDASASGHDAIQAARGESLARLRSRVRRIGAMVDTAEGAREVADMEPARVEALRSAIAALHPEADALNVSLRLHKTGEPGASPGPWLDAVAAAQVGDMALLARLLGDAGRAATGEPGRAPPEAPEPAAVGVYVASGAARLSGDLAPGPAAGRATPPRYRDLVRRYYERLAADERDRR